MLLPPAPSKVDKQVLLSENKAPVVIIRIADPDFLGMLDIRPVNLPEGLVPGIDPFGIPPADTYPVRIQADTK
jgi:hypothetical protein